jgi:hypothetical protein
MTPSPHRNISIRSWQYNTLSPQRPKCRRLGTNERGCFIAATSKKQDVIRVSELPSELIEESPCCCGGEWNSVIEAPAKFFSGGPFSPVGGDPRISGEQRHQIESPKRAPKESAQGRLPLPGFQKFVRLSWSFRQSGGLEYMSAGRCEVAVASPSCALGRASDVPQCQSGPLELGRRAFR